MCCVEKPLCILLGKMASRHTDERHVNWRFNDKMYDKCLKTDFISGRVAEVSAAAPAVGAVPAPAAAARRAACVIAVAPATGE